MIKIHDSTPLVMHLYGNIMFLVRRVSSRVQCLPGPGAVKGGEGTAGEPIFTLPSYLSVDGGEIPR
jgi:hypothetical protein